MMPFESAWELYSGIQYGMTREESAKLHELTTAAGPGQIVEVGSMQGGSACIMESTGRDVLCIDPFGHRLYYSMFRDNCRGKRITHVRARDCDVWGLKKLWTTPIGLLLIDHDHSYESTLASLQNWRPHLASGAIVLVHDYGDAHWVDVEPATTASEFPITGVVGRLAWGSWPAST